MALISMRQYAKIRGVSPEAVSKAARTGRISTVLDEKGRKWIDPEVADREWDANSAPEKKTTATRAEAGKAEKTAISSPSEGEKQPENEAAPPAYAKSKAIREAYAARLAGLEYQERLGKLISADKVRLSAYRIGQTVRQNILNLANDLPPKLAAETDQKKIRIILMEELTKALEALSRVKIDGVD